MLPCVQRLVCHWQWPRMLLLAAIGGASLMLSGCVGQPIANAPPIVSPSQTASVDIIELIASQMPPGTEAGVARCPGATPGSQDKTSRGLGLYFRRSRFEPESRPLECILGVFNHAGFVPFDPSQAQIDPEAPDPTTARLAHVPRGSAEAARNRILDRLVSASTASCDDYVDNLQTILSEQDFAFGSVTTILAGAGGLVGAESVAKALSGTASIVSGVDSQFKESFFSSFATHVLSPAIRTRRAELLRDIRPHRAEMLTQYSLEQGLADVLAFHGACNMTVAVEVASAAVKQAEQRNENAGTTQLMQSLNRRIDSLNALAARAEPKGSDKKSRANNAGKIDDVRTEINLLQDQLSEYRNLPLDLAPAENQIVDLATRVEALKKKLDGAALPPDETDAALND